MAPATAQAPEIQFAQRLAANEKRIRDRAVKKLRGYISVRTQRPDGGFSQEELLKIWKGLFYCMWMQDKPLLQEELANNISQLIHVIQNTEAQHLFIRTFWQTMSREWNGIDNLRLDKYYMLIRMILRQSFEVLKRNDWDESLSEMLLQLLMKEVMDPDSNTPKGIKFHFIDIYLQELAKVGAKELTADQSLKFIEPFCNFVAKSKDPSVMHAVASGIFEIIVDQSPYAIEDLMKELESSSDEEDVSEDDEQGKKEMLKTKANRRLSGKSAQSAEKTEDAYENADDSIGPVLQFDYKAVADKLFELASKKNTPALNRKRLYKLVKKFQDLAEGIFPQDFPEDVSTDEDDDTFSRGRRKKKVVKPSEKNSLEKVKGSGKDEQETSSAKEASVPQKRRKKRKIRERPHADSGTIDGNSEEGVAETSGSVKFNPGKMPENNKLKKKKLLVNETNEIRNAVSETRDKHSITAQSSQTDTEQSKKIQSEKTNPKVQNVLGKLECQNGAANANKAEHVNPSVTPLIPKAGKKKQKAEFALVNGENFLQQAELKSNKKDPPSRDVDSESEPARKVKLKKKTKLVALEGMKVSNQKTATLKKKRKVIEVINSVEGNGILETACKKSRKEESSTALLPLKKKKAKQGSDFVKFEKSTVPKALLFRKARSAISTRASIPLNKLQSSGSKKVTFGLNKNMTAEFKKTDKSILVSPEGPSRVAFNPAQKPRHGVLKSPAGTPDREPELKKPLTAQTKKKITARGFF
ncbi:ribosomal RNA processing protein 1 homolog B [Tympanuchus pallidicinctus]|uniref:ribosomal RNA processing protein 1 homolog B n=1 Tax=Tympanuchus pallidicinctus TaxID=109042 RepID=UPI00228757D9|nr:ribosomal RNA processing protein 1 homolog B [Tympanuchus pallidicinctus]